MSTEDLFGMDYCEFRCMLLDILPEFKEDYYGYDKRYVLSDDMLLNAIQILTMVYVYVQKFDWASKNYETMFACLQQIVENNEVEFLYDHDHLSLDRPLLKRLKGGKGRNEIFAAAKLLDYYRRAFPISNTHDDYKCSLLAAKIMEKCKKSMKNGLQWPLEKNPKFPIRLKEYLDEYIVGQEKMKKILSMSVYHYLCGEEVKPILLIGDTGSGKNHSMNILSQWDVLKGKMVVFTYDMSRITPNGFDGDSIKDLIKQYKKKAEAIGAECDRGIIYLDEIDKLVKPNYDGQGENVNALVQCQLLSLLSGTVIEGIDTSKLMFVLGGAFLDLSELHKSKRRMGFFSGTDENMFSEKNSLRDDLIQIGTERELLGRISYIVQMDRLGSDQMKSILLHEKIGPISKKKSEYAVDGLTLEIDENVLDMLVEKIMRQNLGVRSAVNVLNEMLGSYSFDMLMNDYDTIRIHSGMICNDEPPIFEKKRSVR